MHSEEWQLYSSIFMTGFHIYHSLSCNFLKVHKPSIIKYCKVDFQTVYEGEF